MTINHNDSHGFPMVNRAEGTTPEPSDAPETTTEAEDEGDADAACHSVLDFGPLAFFRPGKWVKNVGKCWKNRGKTLEQP